MNSWLVCIYVSFSSVLPGIHSTSQIVNTCLSQNPRTLQSLLLHPANLSVEFDSFQWSPKALLHHLFPSTFVFCLWFRWNISIRLMIGLQILFLLQSPNCNAFLFRIQFLKWRSAPLLYCVDHTEQPWCMCRGHCTAAWKKKKKPGGREPGGG